MRRLEELCGFLEDLLRVRVFTVEPEANLAPFCAEVRFHRAQRYLYPEALSMLFDGLEEHHLISLNDDFQVRLLLGRTREGAFLFGPYCGESLTRWDAHILLERCGISRKYERDLLAYRSAFPVLPEREAVRIVCAAMSRISGKGEAPTVRTIDLQSPPVVSEDAPIEQPYAEAVSRRYAIEQDMMDAIERGNAERALSDWRQLHQRMDFRRKPLGESLETSLLSAAVTRTVVRIAAMRTSLPPALIDQITEEVSRRNVKETSSAGIEANTEYLIRFLCREIRKRRRENVSYLTASVKFYLESHYSEKVSIADMAGKMGVSKSHLITRFRMESGATPVEYLRAIRMSKAAELLAGSGKTIQEIASDIGIPDANYFVKLFRQQYNLTPSAYRKASRR